MLVGNRHLTWTLMFLSGIICSQWKVKYPQLNICAVKGSSVVVPCSFHRPKNLRPQKIIWGHVKCHGVKPHPIFVPAFKSSFKYIGDLYHNCSLKINQVDYEDAGKYSIKFIVNNKKEYAGARSIPELKVVDLKVEFNGNKTIKEGESVNLTCINSCNRDVSSDFLWFKNGEFVNDGAVLYLSNMSYTSSGNYTCSLKTHMEATSAVIHINVEYAPKNTSASISPSADRDAGITLVCSSQANPPVEAYTWFKAAEDGSLFVGYNPVFSPADSGQYFCSVTNRHGTQNSSIITINTQALWTTLPRVALIITTIAVLLTAVAALLIIRSLISNRPGIVQNNINCPEFASNQQQERYQSEEETTDIVYAALYFNTHRNMEQHTAPHDEDDEDEDDGTVIYSTVCRNQNLNTSYIDMGERNESY